jgi:hypothetical protein
MDFLDDFPTGRDSLPRCPRRRQGVVSRRPITSIISEFHQAPLGGGGAGENPSAIPSRLAPPFPTFTQPETPAEEPLELLND